MLSERRFNFLLLLCFFIFSWWLMWKSFGYNSQKHEFRIARHEVGDFGLHLSLIRSFSWGENMPVESPFFPGTPLPYHFYIDYLVGQLERVGVRIDYALNGVSAVAFTLLLYSIYTFAQVIFGKNRTLGLLSVILFILPSSLTFVDYFRSNGISLVSLSGLWRLPDYIHKGPFDGSMVSIFFTLNPYLNQRHLIVGLMIGLIVIAFVVKKIKEHQVITVGQLIVLGLLLGFSSRIHTLVAASSIMVLTFLFILFGRYRWAMMFCASALVALSTHLRTIVGQQIVTSFQPGFLAQKPLTVMSFIAYWWYNLGLALVLVPLGFIISNQVQRKIFLSFLSLFVVANLFQLSFRMDHNHALVNFFLIAANFYIAYALIRIAGYKPAGVIVSLCLLFCLTISGFMNLMAVKNDFAYPLSDAPANGFMQWTRDHTSPKAIFLARPEILDPITLSGRKNYLGHSYYLSVMGYETTHRAALVQSFFEAHDVSTLARMRQEGIGYVAIPGGEVADFHYTIHKEFFDTQLARVYEDATVIVYKL